ALSAARARPTVIPAADPAAAGPVGDARRRGTALVRTVAALGAVMALAGMEHGIGELAQGNVAPPGTFIQSWPDAEAFRVLSGEPAMTVVPNMLATGVLAIVSSACVLVWATAFAHRPGGGVVLILLSLSMLLVGGGIGPPLIGVLLGAAATRIGTPLPWWRARLRDPARRWLAAGWVPLLAADVAAWLSLLLSVAVVGQLFGAGAVPEWLVYGLMAAAFVLLPFALIAAVARDLS
ncbi:MAG TPA: hypothetical protein VFN74_14145, partial [Chloroflexota bacterium]|nr:hypothetical protein [Chloroflexota bacterium]